MSLRRIPLGLVVVVAVLAAHAASLGGGFHLDDESVILGNRANLEDPGTIAGFFSDASIYTGTPRNAMYRPVAHASHVMDSLLWGWTEEGPRPAGWHLTNLLLHAGTALVLYHLLRRILRAGPPGEAPIPGGPDAPTAAALLGALWFGLQPVNSEVVNYVSSRSESLAALFFLLALLAHHAAWDDGVPTGRRVALVLASVAAGLLSFGSKETGILLPAVAAALEVWARPAEPGPGRLRQAVLRALPFAAAAAAYLLARRAALGIATVDLADRAAMAGAGVDPMLGGGRSVAAHLLTQARVVATWALLVAFPVDLAPDHGARVSSAPDLPTAVAILGLLVAGVLAARAAARGCRRVPLAVVWAAAAAAPSVLVPLNVLMNEHRLYLPATGLALLAGTALVAVLRAARRAGRPLVGLAPVIGLLALFSAADVSRAADWADPFRLWRRAVEASPASWRNHLLLGVEAFRYGSRQYARLDETKGAEPMKDLFLAADAGFAVDFALEQFREAHRIYPRAFETRLNLGYLHLYRGQLLNREEHPDAPRDVEEYREAIRWFTLAEESSPGSFRALYNRATAMARAGMVPEATAEFERLAQDRSRTTMYAWPLADLYRRAGRTGDALAQLDVVERLAPAEAGAAALRRAEVLVAARRFAEAEKALRGAIAILGEGDPGPPVQMARLLVATGIPENLPTAAALWKAALERGHRPGPRDRDLLAALAALK